LEEARASQSLIRFPQEHPMLKPISAILAALMIVSISVNADSMLPKRYLVYFGTYTGSSKGIYVSRFDTASGELSAPTLAAKSANPSFLATTPDNRFLFAVNETGHFAGQPGGAVSAFKLDAHTGELELLNQQPSEGTSPCHIITDRTGKYVFVANYSSGSVAVFPVQTNGSIGAPTTVIQHHGSSVNTNQQAGPHAHCVTMDAENRLVFVCDLGLDKVMIYQFNETDGTLVADKNTSVELKPGSGPRHMVFSPDKRRAYVINELSSTLTTFAYDPEHGTLKEIQTVSTLPEDFHGKNACAEVAVHPSGKFVYGSNRGHDSIAVFAVDEQSGRLNFVERQSTRGKIPRNFAIDPTGQYLITANQDSGNIVVFRIDTKTGRLAPTGQTILLGKPTCVAFVPAEPAAP
jgi:6-phosphogluconolactonase